MYVRIDPPMWFYVLAVYLCLQMSLGTMSACLVVSISKQISRQDVTELEESSRQRGDNGGAGGGARLFLYSDNRP